MKDQQDIYDRVAKRAHNEMYIFESAALQACKTMYIFCLESAWNDGGEKPNWATEEHAIKAADNAHNVYLNYIDEHIGNLVEEK